MGFRGVVMGVEYDEPKAFEKAARDAGFRKGANHIRGGRYEKWFKVGMPIAFRLTATGEILRGQVWSRSNKDRTIIAALDNGEYASISTRNLGGHIITPLGQKTDQTGRVPTARELRS